MIGGIIACQLSIDDFATKECLFTYAASICKLVTHTTLPINIYIYIYVSKSQWLVGKTWSKGSPGSPPLLGEECNKHQKAFGIAPSFRISHLRFSKLTSIANKQIIFQTLPDPHVWGSVSMTQGQPGSNSHNSPPPRCLHLWSSVGSPPKT